MDCRYNGLGYRIAATEPGGVEYFFVYDTNWRILETWREDDADPKERLPLPECHAAKEVVMWWRIATLIIVSGCLCACVADPATVDGGGTASIRGTWSSEISSPEPAVRYLRFLPDGTGGLVGQGGGTMLGDEIEWERTEAGDVVVRDTGGEVIYRLQHQDGVLIPDDAPEAPFQRVDDEQHDWLFRGMSE